MRFRLGTLSALFIFLLSMTAAQDAPQRIRIAGGVPGPKLLEDVAPEYPPLARQAKIQGRVRLQITIDTQGNVIICDVLSGHPLLQQAAIQSVRKRKYQPVLLNGQPVEAVFDVVVPFALQPGSDPPDSPFPPMETDPEKADLNAWRRSMDMRARLGETGVSFQHACGTILGILISNYQPAARTRADEHIRELESWLQQNPADSQARHLLANLRVSAKNDRQGGIEQFRTLLDTDPNFDDAYFMLVQFLPRETVLSELQQMIAKHPTAPAAHLAYAQRLYLTDTAGALREVREAFRLDPINFQGRRLLSSIFSKLREDGDTEQMQLLRELYLEAQKYPEPPRREAAGIVRQMYERFAARFASGADRQADGDPLGANEAAVMGWLRSINTANETYASRYGRGFAAALAALGWAPGEPSNAAAQLIEPILATGTMNGYEFVYVATDAAPDGTVKSFAVYADPIEPGTTGSRWFYTDQSGVIRFSKTGRASAADPPIS